MVFCNVAGYRNIIGGLGNNLFKIAAAASLAYDNEDELLVSTWRYDIFDKIKFGAKRENCNIEHIYYEPSFSFNKIPFEKNMEIVGSFQSEKYFNKDHIRHIFDPKDSVKNYIKNKYSDLLNNKTTSLHIRRGDYLTNHERHPVLDLSYYKNSIEKLEDITDIFIVFSDDIEWCESLPLFQNEKFKFVKGERDYIDLFLMSMCNNNIIANSSFSWWGAWLNSDNEKVVIAPSVWFGPKLPLDTKDIIPEGWMKI